MVTDEFLWQRISNVENISLSWYHYGQKQIDCDDDIDGLAQDCSISSADALEILQSCTKSSIWGRDCYLVWVSFSSADLGSLVARRALRQGQTIGRSEPRDAIVRDLHVHLEICEILITESHGEIFTKKTPGS